MSRNGSIHSTVRPIVVEYIKAFEPEKAADLILNFLLDLALEAAKEEPVAPKAQKKRGRPPGRPGALIPPPELAEPISPRKEFTVPQAAELLGMTEGTFRAFYARPDTIDVIRRQQEDGRTRVTVLGSEIIRVRDQRIRAKEEAHGN